MNRGSCQALCMGMAAALLAACHAPYYSLTPLGQPELPAPSAAGSLPNVKKTALLYISVYDQNEIDIVTYPKGKPIASIAGISGVEGLCSDARATFLYQLSPVRSSSIRMVEPLQLQHYLILATLRRTVRLTPLAVT